MRIANPLINFRTLTDRNFRVCCIIIFCAFACSTPTPRSLPALAAIALRLRRDDLRPGALAGGSLRGHHARRSSVACSARGVDARYLMAAGLLVAGRRQLLDVALEPGHQPVAGRLAARRGHRAACR